VIQRRAVAGMVCAATLSLLAGCGFDSPDVQATEHASVQAADFNVGTVHVGDAFIAAANPDAATPASPGSNLVATFVNSGATTVSLTGVTSPLGATTVSGAGVVPAGVSGSALTLPPKSVLVHVGAAASDPTITIATTSAPVVGSFVPITFTFSSGQTSGVVQVPVVPPGETTAATQPVPTAVASVPSPVGVSASD
jgi:hypothetical protein